MTSTGGGCGGMGMAGLLVCLRNFLRVFSMGAYSMASSSSSSARGPPDFLLPVRMRRVSLFNFRPFPLAMANVRSFGIFLLVSTSCFSAARRPALLSKAFSVMAPL